jgi:hypothetical protein
MPLLGIGGYLLSWAVTLLVIAFIVFAAIFFIYKGIVAIADIPHQKRKALLSGEAEGMSTATALNSLQSA